MNHELFFFICGGILAASAVIVSLFGLKKDDFPGKFMPLIIVWFAVFAIGAGTFAVLHGKDESKEHDAEYAKASEEIQKADTTGPFEQAELEKNEEEEAASGEESGAGEGAEGSEAEVEAEGEELGGEGEVEQEGEGGEQLEGEAGASTPVAIPNWAPSSSPKTARPATAPPVTAATAAPISRPCRSPRPKQARSNRSPTAVAGCPRSAGSCRKKKSKTSPPTSRRKSPTANSPSVARVPLIFPAARYPERVKRFHVTTFGCQMNVHDSERMRGMLTSLGYTRPTAAPTPT